MSGFFYNLGRRLGRAAVPAIRKGRWVWDGLTGSEEDAFRAEGALGSALALEFREVAGVGEVADTILVQELVQRLAAGVGGRRRGWRAEVVRGGEANAVALPGGFLFVSEGLMELSLRRREELAFVLGHEMAHVFLGHAWDRMINQSALDMASVLVSRAPFGGWLRGQGMRLLRSAHARDSEFEADREGMVLVRRAGYDSRGGLALLRRFERGGVKGGVVGEYFSSHPPVAERCARLEWQVREEEG